ncbi:MAG TPA: hypothetical protein GXX19_04850 [Syntrophomonadaceae bacterium]|nr:hypothetical protein [Syntrophomonadaceae bacterium]
MRSVKKKLSLLLVLVLLVNMLLPGMSALAAEANNNIVVPAGKGISVQPAPGQDGRVEAQGVKTAAIKAAIRKLVYYLRHNVDTVISELRDYIPGRYLTVLKNNAGKIAVFLERLLTWEELAYQTIYDQTYNFLRWNLRFAHTTSHWIALGLKWIVEWGLL